MGTFKIRYLVGKKKKNHILYYWQPKRDLVKRGFLPRRLARETNLLEDAIKEAEELNAQLDKERIEPNITGYKEGTIGWHIGKYKQDIMFTQLTNKTQTGYIHYLARLETWAGEYSPKVITIKNARDFYQGLLKKLGGGDGSQKGVYESFHAVKVARRFMEYLRVEGVVRDNPFNKLGVITPKARTKVWEENEVQAFLCKAEELKRFSMRNALIIAQYTGQRPTDIRVMRIDQYDGESLLVVQQKTGVFVKIKCLPEVKIILDAYRETQKTYIVENENTSAPYTETNFSHVFSEIREAAGIRKELQFKDSRRTAVVNLCRAKCTIAQIASITGHSVNTCQKIIDTYFPKDAIAAAQGIDNLEAYRNKKLEQKNGTVEK